MQKITIQELYDELIEQQKIVECRYPKDIYELNKRLDRLLFSITHYIETNYDIKKNEECDGCSCQSCGLSKESKCKGNSYLWFFQELINKYFDLEEENKDCEKEIDFLNSVIDVMAEDLAKLSDLFDKEEIKNRYCYYGGAKLEDNGIEK